MPPQRNTTVHTHSPAAEASEAAHWLAAALQAPGPGFPRQCTSAMHHTTPQQCWRSQQTNDVLIGMVRRRLTHRHASPRDARWPARTVPLSAGASPSYSLLLHTAPAATTNRKRPTAYNHPAPRAHNTTSVNVEIALSSIYAPQLAKGMQPPVQPNVPWLAPAFGPHNQWSRVGKRPLR